MHVRRDTNLNFKDRYQSRRTRSYINTRLLYLTFLHAYWENWIKSESLLRSTIHAIRGCFR